MESTMNHIIKLIITKNKIKIFHHIPWKELKNYHGIQKIWIWFIAHFAATLKGEPIALLNKLKETSYLKNLKELIPDIDLIIHEHPDIKIKLTLSTKTTNTINK